MLVDRSVAEMNLDPSEALVLFSAGTIYVRCLETFFDSGKPRGGHPEGDWRSLGSCGGNCWRELSSSENNIKEVERSLSSDLQRANRGVGAFTGQRAARGLVLFWRDNAKRPWQALLRILLIIHLLTGIMVYGELDISK